MNLFKRWFSEASPQLKLSPDAFSDGQLGSKLWLCGKLESTLLSKFPETSFAVSVFAGWYGLLPFLLLSRGRLPLVNVSLYDLDPIAVANSLKINDHWRIQGLYKAFCQNVNEPFEPQSIPQTPDKDCRRVYINTSCEHFDENEMGWWNGIPAGSVVAIQGTDMKHVQHVREFTSLEIFRDSYGPWSEILVQDQIDFAYTNFRFSRFMVIGIKG
jgi:hypothetical protein